VFLSDSDPDNHPTVTRHFRNRQDVPIAFGGAAILRASASRRREEVRNNR